MWTISEIREVWEKSQRERGIFDSGNFGKRIGQSFRRFRGMQNGTRAPTGDVEGAAGLTAIELASGWSVHERTDPVRRNCVEDGLCREIEKDEERQGR